MKRAIIVMGIGLFFLLSDAALMAASFRTTRARVEIQHGKSHSGQFYFQSDEVEIPTEQPEISGTMPPSWITAQWIQSWSQRRHSL